MPLFGLSVFNGLIVAAVFSHMVIAGHPMFEPKIGYARSSIFSAAKDVLHPELTSNGTSGPTVPREAPFDSHINRRWIAPGLRKGNLGTTLWEDKTIVYCWPDAATKALLEEDLESAFEIWYAAGLREAGFGHKSVDNLEACDNEVYAMIVHYNLPKSQGGTGALTTTVGCPNNPKIGKYWMYLSDDPTVGSLNVVANYVHEIGHAWGLFHEHQNPYLWADQGNGGKGGTLFTQASFNCQNLADYESSLARANAIINDPTSSAEDIAEYTLLRGGMCTDRALAQELGFGAKEWLPLSGTDGFYEVGSTVIDSVDWDSVMLYPSGAGGATLASGERALVLTKANGDAIPSNLRPSQQDINALIELYADEGSSDYVTEPLLNDSQSPDYDKFTEVRGVGTLTC